MIAVPPQIYGNSYEFRLIGQYKFARPILRSESDAALGASRASAHCSSRARLLQRSSRKVFKSFDPLSRISRQLSLEPQNDPTWFRS